MEQFGQTGTSRSRDEKEFVPSDAKPVSKEITPVTNSNVTLWTVTADNFLMIEDFGVCNVAGVAIAVTVYVVPDGGAAGNGNKVYDAYPVIANDSGSLTALIGYQVAPLSFIVAVTDNATGANFWLSGYETVGAGRL